MDLEGVPNLTEKSEVVKMLKKIAPDRDPLVDPLFTLTEVAKSPRVIKSHLSVDLFPQSMLETSKVKQHACLLSSAIICFEQHISVTSSN